MCPNLTRASEFVTDNEIFVSWVDQHCLNDSFMFLCLVHYSR